MPMYKIGGPVTVTSPDGYPICSVSSSTNTGGVTAVYMQQQVCGTQQVIHIDGASKPGTFTMHIFANTRDRVNNGKYIRYDGYITVNVLSVPTFNVSAGPVQLVRDAGNSVYIVKVDVTLTRDAAYNGSITHGVSGYQNCQSQSFDWTSGNTYTWTCFPQNPLPQDYTVKFYFQDASTTKMASARVVY
jgi:hypothetical protein